MFEVGFLAVCKGFHGCRHDGGGWVGRVVFVRPLILKVFWKAVRHRGDWFLAPGGLIVTVYAVVFLLVFWLHDA
jgi:hypothetical protein